MLNREPGQRAEQLRMMTRCAGEIAHFVMPQALDSTAKDIDDVRAEYDDMVETVLAEISVRLDDNFQILWLEAAAEAIAVRLEL